MARLAELSRQISPELKVPLVITGATLIDGNGGAPVPDAVVVVEAGRITAVGRQDTVPIPKRAKIINARGKFLLPEFGTCTHISNKSNGYATYLAAGVTTVRDVGERIRVHNRRSGRTAPGSEGLGPRMLLAGIIDGESKTAWGLIRASTPAEAEATVNRYYQAGFQQIKIYSSVQPEIVEAICAAAHQRGMTVTGHVPNGLNALQAVEAGMDQINHVQYLLPVLRSRAFRPLQGAPPPPLDFQSPEAIKAIELFKSHNTVIDPTLSVFEWSLHPAAKSFPTIEPGAGRCLVNSLEQSIILESLRTQLLKLQQSSSVTMQS